MSFYRPDSLLAAVNPLCKSTDLNGITPEKEEFQPESGNCYLNVQQCAVQTYMSTGVQARAPRQRGQLGGPTGPEQGQHCSAGRHTAVGRGRFLLSHIIAARSPGLVVCHCMIAAQGNTSVLLLIAGIHLRGVF